MLATAETKFTCFNPQQIFFLGDEIKVSGECDMYGVEETFLEGFD